MELERFHQRGYTGAMSDMSSQPDQASGSARPADGVFVGRQREIDALSSALDDALAGHGRLVMLVGEPGIGKTRTAQELSVLAE